jgi:organic hydroperoxide reductase OsmC/OhrA
MITYPISFHGDSSATPGIAKEWETSSSSLSASCSIPAEFEGISGHYSPEDFFLLALQNCFVATFKVFAHHSKLQFSELDSRATLVVDKNESGKPVMKELNLSVHLEGILDMKKANLLVKKTLESGFILNSVKTTITSEVFINGERIA